MSAETSREGEADSSTDASDKEFSCPVCGSEHDTQPGLNSHVGLAHPKYSTITVECEICGDEIETTRHKADSKRFCSNECKYENHSKEFTGENHPNYSGKKVNCGYCGEELIRIKSRREECENQFCDNECYSNYISESGVYEGENNPVYNSVTLECEYCGTEFDVPQSIADADRRFCDIDCKSSWISDELSGENHPLYEGYSEKTYGSNWRFIRDDVRERDDYRCQGCGKPESNMSRELDVHHIMPLKRFDTPKEANQMNNLVALCPECHHKYEGLHLRPDTR